MSKNNYFYYDEYMYFTFNTRHSSDFNIFIQNDPEDLKMYVNTGAKVDFIQPSHRDGQMVQNVSNPQRTFKLKIAAKGCTREDAAAIAKWLKVGTEGALSFDFANDWSFDVIVQALDDFNLYEDGEEIDKFILSSTVTFVTTHSPYAYLQKGNIDSVNHSIINDEEYSLKYYSLSPENLSGGLVNNTYYIPCASTASTSHSGYNFYTDDIRLHFLGDEKLYIDAQFYIKENSYGQKINIEISTFASLNLTIQTSSAIIIDFIGEHNLFLFNNMLLSQAEKIGLISIDNKSYQSGYEPAIFSSPGNIIEIPKEYFSNVEPSTSFLSIFDTAYDWFVCNSCNTGSDNTFAEVESYYPLQITSNCYVVYKELFDEQDGGIEDWIESIYKKYKDYFNTDTGKDAKCYFGFYSKINVKYSPNISEVKYIVRQYTEVI